MDMEPRREVTVQPCVSWCNCRIRSTQGAPALRSRAVACMRATIAGTEYDALILGQAGKRVRNAVEGALHVKRHDYCR